MKQPIIIEFRKEKIKLKPFIYNDGKVGILLIGLNNHFHGSATVNMNCNIDKNETIIKNYDEYKGLYEIFLKNNIIKSYRRTIDIGLKKALVCEVTDEFIKSIKK